MWLDVSIAAVASLEAEIQLAGTPKPVDLHACLPLRGSSAKAVVPGFLHLTLHEAAMHNLGISSIRSLETLRFGFLLNLIIKISGYGVRFGSGPRFLFSAL